MKKLNIFLLMVLVCSTLQAQVSKSVTIATAGSLGTTLTATELSTVTNLTIIGNLDARDFKTMRDNMPVLAVLNMSAVSIKAFQGSGGTDANYVAYYVNEIPYYAFYDAYYSRVGKTSLTSITLPSSLTGIQIWAFRNCTGLTSIKIPNGVTLIGERAFDGCSSITSVAIPNLVTSIGSYAFNSCSGITSVTMGTGVTSIGSFAFNGCSLITEMIIPNSVTSIGADAFEFCMGLTNITIPDAVTSVGAFAFQFCSGLTNVTIGSKVSTIGEAAFANCEAITSIFSKNVTPPTLGLNSLAGIPLTSVINVPLSSLTAYKAAAGWKDYLATIKSNDLNITVQIGTGGIVKENNVTLTNGANVNVTSGTSKTFTFTPTAGYEVATLTFGGVDVKSQMTANQYTTPAVTVTKTLAVTFQKMQYSLSLKSAEAGTMNLAVEYGSTLVFDFTPATNWKVSAVFYNNADVTASLVNGVYTVPAITDNALLNVSFVSTITDAPELVSSNVKVYSTQSEIIIDGTAEGENITLYTVNGKQLQTVKSQGSSMVFPAQNGAVYLVKTAGRTYKVML